MSEEVEKIYCNDNSAMNPMCMAAMMNGGGFNGAWNNPMMYLVWMWMMRWMNGGYGFENGGAENFNSRAISQLQSTVDSNHNNDLVMQAINGNRGAIHELATNLNCDFNTLSQAICGVKSAIEQVGGQIGYSSERVINAVNLGDQNIIQQMCNCCCQQKELIIRGNYENQLATERQTNILGGQVADFRAASQLQNCQQTNALQNSIESVRQATVNGFANIGYQMASDKSEIIQNATANTQRIMDLLNNRWYTETANALQDSKMEVSQLKQTQALIAALKTTA